VAESSGREYCAGREMIDGGKIVWGMSRGYVGRVRRGWITKSQSTHTHMRGML